MRKVVVEVQAFGDAAPRQAVTASYVRILADWRALKESSFNNALFTYDCTANTGLISRP